MPSPDIGTHRASTDGDTFFRMLDSPPEAAGNQLRFPGSEASIPERQTLGEHVLQVWCAGDVQRLLDSFGFLTKRRV